MATKSPNPHEASPKSALMLTPNSRKSWAVRGPSGRVTVESFTLPTMSAAGAGAQPLSAGPTQRSTARMVRADPDRWRVTRRSPSDRLGTDTPLPFTLFARWLSSRNQVTCPCVATRFQAKKA